MTKKIKILLVDDSESNLLAIQAVLGGGEYELFLAESGFEALSILEKTPDIALVILDVQMPEMDGYETAIHIKRMENFHDVPIIFITAIYREDPYVLKGYSVGGIDYFSKPFDPDILKIKVGIYAAHKQKSLLLMEREKRIHETEELLKTGKKLSFLLESLPVGVLIVDIDGKICQTNEELSRIFSSKLSLDKVEYGDILGWWDKSGKVIRETNGPLERALHQGISTHNEMLTVNCLDGDQKTLYVSASPLISLRGHIVGAGVVIQDVTESKKVEEDLEEKIMNLITLGVELNDISTNLN